MINLTNLIQNQFPSYINMSAQWRDRKSTIDILQSSIQS